MTDLFAQVVTASGYGSVIILAVCLLRLVLKRAPKNTVCLLWMLVGLRLLMPFEIESRFSLQPKVEPVVLEQPLTITVQEDVPPSEADAALPGYTMQQTTVVHQEEEGKLHNLQAGDILSWVWLAGMTVLAASGIFSYWKLKRRIREAWRTGDGCWECAGLDTAFVMGILRPRVYLPAGLGAEERAIIVSHERAHIRRLDHFWKLAGYMALTVHWFNPLVWLAYICLCKDMELACDESVIRDMSIHERKAYSKVLVSCAAHHRFIAACPVAFGEVSVRERVKSVMNYKKPKFWIILIAVVALVVTAVCFLTSPSTEEERKLAQCREALERWQSNENYHIFQENQFSGNVLNETSQMEYWVSGEDWLSTVTIAEINLGSEWCRMKKDGVEYERYFHDLDTETPGGWPWAVTETPSSVMNENWPMCFRWEDSEIAYEGCEQTNGKESITLSVTDNHTVFSEYAPYTVTFCFDEARRLENIVLTWDTSNTEERWYKVRETVSTFTLLSTDAAQINGAIEAAHTECLAENGVKGQMQIRGLICMDRNCTDSSHDHSGIHCLDTNCTNASHDHSARDCNDTNCTDSSHSHHHHDH